MSVASSVPDRVARWLDAEDQGGVLAAYRRVFAAIWVVYDVVDLVWGMTERSRIWFPHERMGGLMALQVVLIVSGAMLVLGRHVWIVGMVAAVVRGAEAFEYFPLNDFFFVSVVYVFLAHSDGGPFRPEPSGSGPLRERAPQTPQTPAWVRDALLVQLGWIYVTTGILKMNPDWLDGGQLFVRSQYLWNGQDWPYPAFVEKSLAVVAVDARLSQLGALSEIVLGVVVLARRPYWVAVALAVGIHGFGALVTNVWFFSASMIAGVVILVPRPAARIRKRGLCSP